MATLPVVNTAHPDDSEFESINGQLRRRPVPGEEHAALALYCVQALGTFAQERRGKVLSEWSLSDGKGQWLTPDVMMANEGFRKTNRGHLWAPPPPHLVIEIRSVDQPVRELFDKTHEYRAYGVPFYWVIDPVERACYEALTMGSEFSVRVVPRTDRLSAADVYLEVAALWAFLDVQN